MNIEILEEAAGIAAKNLFNMKYPDKDVDSKEMKECISDAVFIINNFMRISADLMEKQNADSDNS